MRRGLKVLKRILGGCLLRRRDKVVALDYVEREEVQST
jgi:hypothetical protein